MADVCLADTPDGTRDRRIVVAMQKSFELVSDSQPPMSLCSGPRRLRPT